MRYSYSNALGGVVRVYDEKDAVVASFCDAKAFNMFAAGVATSKADELFNKDTNQLVVGPIGEMV